VRTILEECNELLNEFNHLSTHAGTEVYFCAPLITRAAEALRSTIQGYNEVLRENKEDHLRQAQAIAELRTSVRETLGL
jgi:RsiW-degrading membrane proteinase PrsW (M82 family)